MELYSSLTHRATVFAETAARPGPLAVFLLVGAGRSGHDSTMERSLIPERSKQHTRPALKKFLLPESKIF
ncbi:hypothetical protein [Thauera sp. SDU_THAU2]|uniref:hypothetical protein n=1 Tax=Thauera sp. SDU_THAU2 TaxID=3136633 RepID=UPI00311F60C3